MAEQVVTYQIGANVDDLTRALREADASFARLSGSIEKALTAGGARGAKGITEAISSQEAAAARAGSSIGNAVGRSIGVALGAAIGSVVTGAALRNAVDGILKQANLAQDNRLTNGQVSGIQTAARANNVSQDQVESALSAFSGVSKKAKDDAEEFYKALGNIGPSFVKAFETAPTQGERLRVISDALASTTDEVKKAQLAQEAFGTDNERLIAALGGGRSALQEYENAARAMGIAVDDAMVAKAKQADTTLSQLAAVISANLRAAIVELGPVLANAAASLGAFADAASRAISAIGGVKYATNNVLREKLAEGDASISALNARRSAIAGQPESTIDRMMGNTREARAALVDRSISEARSARLDAMAELAKRGEYDDPRDLRAKADTAGALRAAVSSPGKAFAPRPSLSDKGGGGGGGGLSDADKAENRLEQYTDSLKRQGDVLQAQIETFGQSNAQQKAAIELAKAKVDLDKVDEATRIRLTEGIRGAVTANEEYRSSLDRLKGAQDAAKSAAGTLSDAFLDMALEGKNAQDVMKNVGKSLLRDLLGGALSGRGSFAGMFGTKESGGIFGSLFSGLFGGIAGRAGGGELPRGFTMVGENGPELLRNSGSGIARVYPSGVSASGMGGGGGGVVMHNDFRGASDSAVAQISARLNQLQATLPKQIAAASQRQQVRGYA